MYDEALDDLQSILDEVECYTGKQREYNAGDYEDIYDAVCDLIDQIGTLEYRIEKLENDVEYYGNFYAEYNWRHNLW